MGSFKQTGLFLILWSLAIVSSVSAQERSYNFDAYDVDKGLSQSSIYSLIQDEEGFLWISTFDGVNRFDGYVFNEYRQIPSPNRSDSKPVERILYSSASQQGRAVVKSFGLHGGRDYEFYKDSRKQLLVVHNTGISLYGQYKNSFRHVFQDTTYVNEEERDFVQKFHVLGEDEATQTLWLWRPMKGLYILDNITYELKKIILYPPDFEKRRLRPATVVKQGDHIWMAFEREQLVKMDIHTTRLTTYCLPTLGKNPVIKLLGPDSLLLASEGHISIFDIKKNSYTDLPVELYNDQHENFQPSVIELDHKGNAWIGGNNGVVVYSLRNHEIVNHIVSFNTFENNSFNRVISLYRDAADNMWVGTDGDGLKKYSPNKKVFSLYRSPRITHNIVKAVYKHDDGRLYVGLWQDGLDIYEKGGRFLKKITNVESPGLFPNNDLHSICRENYESLWFHFKDGGIGLFNVQTERFRDLTAKMKALGLPEQDDEYPFVSKRPNGEVYFNYGEYLLMFSDADKGYKADIVRHFPGENLTCFYEDFWGNQYVGTKAGLYGRAAESSSWEKIPLPPKDVEVKSINKNAHKQLLVATTKGLLILNEKYEVVRHYNSYDYTGMVNDYVYAVLLDDKDDIWVSHNKGITQIKQNSDNLVTYNFEDGLQSNEFNTGAYFKSMDGELFFGGIRGVTGFYPRNFMNNPYTPKVVIKRLEVLDKPYQSDTAISLLHKVELPYNQNTIAIEYVPLEFTNPLKNKVQYMLDGVDEDWLQAGSQTLARYTNLPPGHYIFKVKACNNDEVWNTVPVTLEIVIKIPFWQSLWFRFLLLLLVLGIAYYFSALYLDYKIRNEKLKLEKEQAVDQERARISSDMHDDLGSGLSTIRLLSEIAKRKIKDTGQTKEIERISEAAGELVDKMSEIIWAMNSSNDSLANLIAYMRSFAADFLEHARIQHHFIIPENIPNVKLSGGTRRHIYLAVKESLHNVMKHSQATEVTIEVKVFRNMTIMIKDNGKGFDPEKVRLFGNGLKNIEKRMQQVGGQVDIISQNGTTVFLDIPLN
ncbi:triple tyrosine motif-containing protein [Chitinophaga sp. XS-30]|uniref:ligand-binding sensor domain-containing protein n=1 Tax=Chitinophaga sp. XS-30 TaxID=2604421 RepID=UPI00143D9F08|nr:sensor histidine kinase [Chitinophaga sp. XS-30]